MNSNKKHPIETINLDAVVEEVVARKIEIHRRTGRS
jgi:hypothetical protein